MANIQFNYLYRDGGNYKNYGSVIFKNEQTLNLSLIEVAIKEKLIDEMYFYADKWHVQDLHFDKWDNELDHTWHEFESVAYTDRPSTSLVDISFYLKSISL